MRFDAKESFAQVGENRKMKNGMELGSDDAIGFPNTETSEKNRIWEQQGLAQQKHGIE